MSQITSILDGIRPTAAAAMTAIGKFKFVDVGTKLGESIKRRHAFALNSLSESAVQRNRKHHETWLDCNFGCGSAGQRRCQFVRCSKKSIILVIQEHLRISGSAGRAWHAA